MLEFFSFFSQEESGVSSRYLCALHHIDWISVHVTISTNLTLQRLSAFLVVVNFTSKCNWVGPQSVSLLSHPETANAEYLTLIAMFSHISPRDVEEVGTAWRRPWERVRGIQSENEAVFTVTRSVNCRPDSCFRAQMLKTDIAQRPLLARGERRAAGWPREVRTQPHFPPHGKRLGSLDAWLKRVLLWRRTAGELLEQDALMGRGERGMQGRSIHLRKVRRTEVL